MDQAFTLICFNKFIYESGNYIPSVNFNFEAYELSIKGFEKSNISLKSFNYNGKIYYKTDDLVQKAIIRKCIYNIQKSIKISFKSRNKIVDELIGFLKDGTLYRLYKLDIKSFFESISSEQLYKSLDSNLFLSKQTKGIIKCYFIFYN